jgi:hypothetical protein
MLPRQPRSRSGAWHTVTHPGHGGAGWDRADHRVRQACMRSLRVDGYVARDLCLRTSGHGQPLTAVYALPTTGVNYVRISGYNRYGCCCGRLARWQCAAPAVPARAGLIALPARHARVAQFGVRQPCCRASRALDPARGILLPILVTGVLDGIVPTIASVRHACDPCA